MDKKKLNIGQLVYFDARRWGAKDWFEEEHLVGTVLRPRNLLQIADVYLQVSGIMLEDVPYFYLKPIEK